MSWFAGGYCGGTSDENVSRTVGCSVGSAGGGDDSNDYSRRWGMMMMMMQML